MLFLAWVHLPKPFITDETILDDNDPHKAPAPAKSGTSGRARHRQGRKGNRKGGPPQRPPGSKRSGKSKPNGKSKGSNRDFADVSNEICNYILGKCGVVSEGGRRHAPRLQLPRRRGGGGG